MANIANQGIVNSWSLVSFAHSHGKCKIADLVNSETGEAFKSLAFVASDDSITFVGFSSNLGVLTSTELKARKETLQVVELGSGSFKLCNQGEGGWEDVDL